MNRYHVVCEVEAQTESEAKQKVKDGDYNVVQVDLNERDIEEVETEDDEDEDDDLDDEDDSDDSDDE